MANETKAKTAGKLGGKKMVTQSKVTMNFARHKSDFNFGKVALVALIIIVAILLLGYFALVMRYRSLRRKHLKEKKRAEQRRRQEREQLYRREERPTVKEPTQRINKAELDDQFAGIDDFDKIMREYRGKNKE